MTTPEIIAIDGPAASGKSTLGKNLADYLGYLFFDTGVMYRAVTWLAIERGLDTKNERAITALAEQIEIDVQPSSQEDGRQCDIIADGKDITWQIRSSEVDAKVSLVSSYAGVRKALTVQQRRIGEKGSVVMIGRDIGTVVFPEADLKIYLNASTRERARRRYHEQIEHGLAAYEKQILESMYARDEFDSNRTLAPLKPAEDAWIIGTDDMNSRQVLELVLERIQDLGIENDGTS